LVFVLAIIVSSTAAKAGYLWSIEFNTSIGAYHGDSFEAGVDDHATDGYDLFADAIQVVIPGGEYTIMMTQAGIHTLTKDFRGNFTSSKTWEIRKTAAAT